MKLAIVTNKEQRIVTEQLLKKNKIKAKFTNDLNSIKDNDQVYILSWATFGKTIKEATSILKMLNQRNIELNILNTNTSIILNFNMKQLDQILNIIYAIQHDIMSNNVKIGLNNSIYKPKGKPYGAISKNLKLDQYKDQIIDMLKQNMGVYQIAKVLNVNHQRVRYYIETRLN